MKEFIEYLIKHLVDEPDKVEVHEINGEHTVIFEVRVGEGEMGKVIGRSGQTARSLRTIAGAAAAKHGKRLVLELLESDQMKSKDSQNRSTARDKPARQVNSGSKAIA